jgi:DNA polymerase III sliding clamp (beta) subunit (PCNA family)
MQRTELIEVLEMLRPAIADKGLVPIFTTYCFTGSELYAYNDDLGILTQWESNQPFAVDGNTLLGLLKNSRAKEVEFVFNDENTDAGSVLVKAGRSRFRLPFFTEEEFLFDSPANGAAWDIQIDVDAAFMEGLQFCMVTTSTDNTMPALMGVTLRKEGKGLGLFSCDGDCISRYGFKGKPTDEQYTLPNDFCSAMVKIVAGELGGTKLMLNKEWAWVSFKQGEDRTIEIFGRILSASDKIDHAELIKKTVKAEPDYLGVPDGLDNALSRARVVADSESLPTVISFDAEGKLRLSTESKSLGIVKDMLPTDGHPEVKAAVSAALMQRALTVSDRLAVLENCTVYRKGDNLFQIISNMDAG